MRKTWAIMNMANRIVKDGFFTCDDAYKWLAENKPDNVIWFVVFTRG